MPLSLRVFSAGVLLIVESVTRLAKCLPTTESISDAGRIGDWDMEGAELIGAIQGQEYILEVSEVTITAFLGPSGVERPWSPWSPWSLLLREACGGCGGSGSAGCGGSGSAGSAGCGGRTGISTPLGGHD